MPESIFAAIIRTMAEDMKSTGEAPIESDATVMRNERPLGSVAPHRRLVPNSHARLMGILRPARRGGFLEADDGALWRLHTDQPLEIWFDQRVVVEARVGEQDDLDLFWIGRAPDSSAAA